MVVRILEQHMINSNFALEITGSQLFSRFARKEQEMEMRGKLLWHAQEELRHAMHYQLLMQKLGIPILNVHSKNSYPSYWAPVGADSSLVQFLAIVHALELRAPLYYQYHYDFTMHDEIKKLMKVLIADEDGHIEWIRQYLKAEQRKGNSEVKLAVETALKHEQAYYEGSFPLFAQFGEEGKKYLAILEADKQRAQTFVEQHMLSLIN